MDTEDRLANAIILAANAHRGQLDKGGQPYILHALRVMNRVYGEDYRIAAVLHDVVEDCGIELALIRHRFGDAVSTAVDHLTRRDGESYTAFVRRCANDPIAAAVKWADLTENMDMKRLGRAPTRDDLKRRRKYIAAKGILIAARDSNTHPKGGDVSGSGSAE